MKISWLKAKDDTHSFKILKAIGFDVYEIGDPENTDSKIKELIVNRYDTIVISNELAGFSTDIIKKYGKKEDINIIIAKNKYE
jgi:hypothetical protein